jgi:hypothetical protein
MGVLGGVLLAQTEADFGNWMKAVAKGNGALKGAVASKDAKAVATEAKNLDTIFAQVETYFTSHNMTDAAAMAKTVHANTTKAATAAAAGTIDEAAVAAVGGSCAGCHAAHREKGADGAYKMK